MTAKPTPPPIAVALSELSKRVELSEAAGKASPEGNIAETHDDRLRKRTLTPLIWFYIVSNAVIVAGIFVFAILERVHPSFGEHIITEKVVIALIAGNTVQISAMIIAAFKGLFDAAPAKKKNDKPGLVKSEHGAA